MTINDWIAGDTPLLSNLKSDALELWDAHRTPIVLVIFAVLVALRLYFHASDQRGGLVALPKIYGGEPSTVEAEGPESPSDTDDETESVPEEGAMTTSAGDSKGSRQGLRRRAG